MRISGKNPVIERLRNNPHSIRKIQIQQGFKEAGYIYKKAKQWGIPVVSVPKSKMMKIGRNTNTQGILIHVDEFEYELYGDLVDYAKKKKQTLIFLDGLNDPQNLGAIIRSLACLGHFAIVLPKHGSVEVTEAVLRVASGGDNHVKVSKVQNLSKAMRLAKDEGFTIAGTVVKGGESLVDTKFSFPLGVVIGSEEKGIRDTVRKQLDLAITIPMHAHTLSLNAAHTTTILAYEIFRQRSLHAKK